MYIQKFMSKSFTSVKIDTDVYEEFKKLSVNRRFYLQDLVNRALHLFVKDESFKNIIYNYTVPVLSKESQSDPKPTVATSTDVQCTDLAWFGKLTGTGSVETAQQTPDVESPTNDVVDSNV